MHQSNKTYKMQEWWPMIVVEAMSRYILTNNIALKQQQQTENEIAH